MTRSGYAAADFVLTADGCATESTPNTRTLRESARDRRRYARARIGPARQPR